MGDMSEEERGAFIDLMSAMRRDSGKSQATSSPSSKKKKQGGGEKKSNDAPSSKKKKAPVVESSSSSESESESESEQSDSSSDEGVVEECHRSDKKKSGSKVERDTTELVNRAAGLSIGDTYSKFVQLGKNSIKPSVARKVLEETKIGYDNAPLKGWATKAKNAIGTTQILSKNLPRGRNFTRSTTFQTLFSNVMDLESCRDSVYWDALCGAIHGFVIKTDAAQMTKLIDEVVDNILASRRC